MCAVARVTPAGHIEDEGDFSDFFAVPPDNVHPEEWEHVQQAQDEVSVMATNAWPGHFTFIFHVSFTFS